MTIQSFVSTHLTENRVYFCLNKNLKYEQLKAKICPHRSLEYKGAGIRCYGTFIGWVLNCLKLSTKLTLDGKTFYLNNKSVCKFIIRNHQTKQILKDYVEPDPVNNYGRVAVHLNDLYYLHVGSGYAPDQTKHVLDALKEAKGKIKDLDQFDALLKTLDAAARKIDNENVGAAAAPGDL